MQKLIIRGSKAIYVDLTPEEEAQRLLDIEANRPTAEEIAREDAIKDAPIGARAWFTDNPNARLIWSMSVSDIATEISSLVDASFPSLSAANRMRWKLLITAITLIVKVLVKRERLD